MKKKNPHDETEPPDPEAQADLVEEEAPSPKVCLKHPRAAYYDGLRCPVCAIEREWLALTEDLEP